VKHSYLDERLALHSPLMADAANRYRQVLDRATWGTPRLPYLPNTLARLMPQPSREEFADLLARQLHEPVLWRESLDLAASAVPEPVLVEVGPKSLLHDMAGDRWLSCPLRMTDANQNFMGHFKRLVEEFRSGKRIPSA